ncbi:MAG: ATP synthase F1 subunit epsilon [Oscillospiraceae bacterium]|nr:ATP synthase F1 subunit epsilon [Oscillospiraceae bacterium]MBQ7130719.1 ATP synthase F1 subunit epsilon [Oscillospiraceae bacterium]
MMPFSLKIVTPDGLFFDGQAEQLIVRTSTGDIGIMARHMNYVAPLGMGRAVVIADGKRRNAACIGGMVTVMNGEVTLMPTTFEWAEDIDVERAEKSFQKASKIIEENASETDVKLAKAKISRAMVRKGVAKYRIDIDPNSMNH